MLLICTGHFYLTKLLIPALLKGAQSSRDEKARVVTTSSVASYFGKLDFNTLKDGPARRKQYASVLYNQSKLVSILQWDVAWLALIVSDSCRAMHLYQMNSRSATPIRA